MTPQQIALVQTTFERASRIGPHLTATFYAELFAIDPSLRAMFKTDIIAQSEKLLSTLGFVIAALDDPETILPALRKLAVRHVDYGVEAQHYSVAGTALMRTLRHELGQDFTREARDAWIAAYRLITDTMCEAAYGKAIAPAA